MPELPEVETIRRGLEPFLAGARLSHVEARRPDLRFPLPRDFAGRLTGARIHSLNRRGKYILAPLDQGETLLIHLGMTGRFGVENAAVTRRPGVFERAVPTDDRHGHVIFTTEAGARITYFDARRFGFMDLIASAELGGHQRFAAMGPEPLDPEFDAPYLRAAFRDRRQGAKTLLLDQAIVAGLGNIYVCEALHRARISPLRPAGSLSPIRLERLVQAVRAVIAEAIEAGGSTLRDFADVAGGQGYFQHRFGAYGQAGAACSRDGCQGEIRRIVQAGRSTFYCPRCQK